MREQLEALVLEMHRRGIHYSEAVREFRKAFICAVLHVNNGNQLRSAQQMGVHRNTIRRFISELRIDLDTLRPTVQRRPPQAERQIPQSKTKRRF
jgi:DNA-binding NtrC family response regulator